MRYLFFNYSPIIYLNLFITLGFPSIDATIETQIFPKETVRHLPLSRLENDAFSRISNKRNKRRAKMYFSKDVVEDLLEMGFKYTEIPEFYQYIIPKEQIEKLPYTDEAKNFQFFNQSLLRQVNPSLYENKEYYQLTDKDVSRQKVFATKYLNRIFDGPQFNLDIRKSTLSELNGVEIYGLFAREYIPNGSVIGNYVGIQGLGASSNPLKFEKSDKEYEYTYDAERDYIDNAYKGNFMRFINHQAAPMMSVERIYVPTRLMLQTGKISMELYNNLPSYVEAMVFTTAQAIYPGEEIFSNYGDGYWENRSIVPVRQRSVESVNRHLKELTAQVKVLENEREDIVSEVKSLRLALELLILRTENHDIVF